MYENVVNPEKYRDSYNKQSLFRLRYRWAFIPEASDDSGLEVRRQGTHQREFKPYVVRLAKLLRKRAKVSHSASYSMTEINDCRPKEAQSGDSLRIFCFMLSYPPPPTLLTHFPLKWLSFIIHFPVSAEKPRGGLLHQNPVMGAWPPDAYPLHHPQHRPTIAILQPAQSGF